jgi:competence protein ComFB
VIKKTFNLTEILVEQVLKEQLKNRTDICTCPVCQSDIMAIALNNLPPKYVNTDKGGTIIKSGVLNTQIATDLLMEVCKAIEHVKGNPRHQQKVSGGRDY